MDLGAWSNQQTDVVRMRRLIGGTIAGALVMGGTLAFVASAAAKAYGLDEDQVIEAAIVDAPEEEPEIEAQPAPEPEQPKPKPRIAPLVAPVEVDTKLTEKEPVNSDNPYGNEDPYALLDQTTAAPVEKPQVVEAPKVIEKPKVVVQKKSNEPIRVTEDVTPPRQVAMVRPEFPAEAKAAGIEGTVIVQYVVTETGEVKDVKAVRGPPELTAVCVEAVKKWKFMPAEKDGKPVAVHRVAKFPFRIKT